MADQASTGAVIEQAPAAAPVEITVLLADAAGHVADALPELLILARGGKHFENRFRPYLNEAIHCLASALEACLIASLDGERAGIGTARKGGEDAVAIMVRDFLDRPAA